MEIVIKTASDSLTMANDTNALRSHLARRRLQDSVPVTVFPVNIDENEILVIVHQRWNELMGLDLRDESDILASGTVYLS
jgi:hypothetical protein